jgi:multidrug efflux system outer membrane protein
MSRTLLLILIAAFLGGCSLAPTYTRPEAPVPASWPASAGPQADKTKEAAADVPWKEFIVDEKLQKVVGLALSNNRDLRVAALTSNGRRPCTASSAPSCCRP